MDDGGAPLHQRGRAVASMSSRSVLADAARPHQRRADRASLASSGLPLRLPRIDAAAAPACRTPRRRGLAPTCGLSRGRRADSVPRFPARALHDKDPNRFSSQHPSDPACGDPAPRRREALGDDLAAGGCGRKPGAGDPRIPALPQARRHDACAMRSPIPISPATAMPRARRHARHRRIPKACCSDEYLQQEQDDALDVIAWIAAQPWCTGTVGMIGISWGGFNGAAGRGAPTAGS